MGARTDSTRDRPGRRICHLEWHINSACDYTCNRCVPEACVQDRPDLGTDTCLEALHSFVALAAEQKREAHITFYPRQAEFTEPFRTVLRKTRELKRQGRMSKVTCVNRGDLPAGKIRLFRDAGVDVCRLTIDGPEAVQDVLRRPGSFRDTLAAFRETRASGIRVVPLMILVRHNAPHAVDILRLMLAEGFDPFLLQAGIDDGMGGKHGKVNAHPHPDSSWNELLSAAGYRAVLLDTLQFLDAAGARRPKFLKRLVQSEPMFARLFFELGRTDEYERLVGRISHEDVLSFVLRPNGTVLCQQHLPELGAFPGGSFRKMCETSHPLRWFDRSNSLEKYRAEQQRAFAKCRACPATKHCKPTLVGAHGRRLFFHPDVHCWVPG